ncbi:MAG: hypothetical protein KDA27_27985 [Candidatus Eisenbacteria bacterium]|uniref:Uncharacterized protein n=1 Tax=Eiseniibacteriota bacterium TaxID=2212470 RepID=A0A956NIM2_UNCEI|nr:hypothetical protein [Candidatus Eisenbacteria bacterium]
MDRLSASFFTFPTLLVLAIVVLCSCGTHDTAPTNPEDPGIDPLEVSAIVLTDDGGDVGVVTSEAGPDPIVLFLDDPTRIGLRLLDADEVPLSDDVIRRLDIVPRDAVDTWLEVSADTTGASPAVSCVGRVFAWTAFHIEVLDQGEVVFRSAAIRVQVVARLPQAIRVQYADGAPFAAGRTLSIFEGEEFDVLGVDYLDETGVVIPQEVLGPLARVEYTSANDAVVSVESGDPPFSLRAYARHAGEADLVARLVHRRTGRVLWEELLFRGRVLPFTTQGWHAYPDGPNGRVKRLLALEEGLLVQGDFTSVGGFAAEGMALWTQDGWAPMNPVPGGVFRFAYDGHRLVASTLAATVVEWNGTDWVTLETLPGVQSVALLDGTILTISEVAATWTPESEGERVTSVAAFGSRLFLLSTGPRLWERIGGTTWQKIAEASSVHETFDGQIPFVTSCDGSVYYSVIGKGQVTLGSVFRAEPDGTSQTIASIPSLDMASLGREFYLLRHGGTVQRGANGVFAPMAPRDLYGACIEAYDGQVFVGGSFREIDGIPTRNFASYRP